MSEQQTGLIGASIANAKRISYDGALNRLSLAERAELKCLEIFYSVLSTLPDDRVYRPNFNRPKEIFLLENRLKQEYKLFLDRRHETPSLRLEFLRSLPTRFPEEVKDIEQSPGMPFPRPLSENPLEVWIGVASAGYSALRQNPATAPHVDRFERGIANSEIVRRLMGR